ncbi:MAG TPA: alkaline phosphatase family protein [Candidatus Binataceae bacterium]|nr:alkaline phosphatase family protein [Candidatus Binataceae bacterium]
MRKSIRLGKATRAVALAAAISLTGAPAATQFALAGTHQGADPTTPIHHVVVIFQENVSFDHYFATYPEAENPSGEPQFHARGGTPSVNGLGTLAQGEPTGVLLTDNPNASNPANGASALNPFRLDRTQAATCDQDHNYGHEQQAFDQGLMDLFPATVGVGGGGCLDYGKGSGLVMGYYDGNTVTALWNYAQHFAMNDNAYGTTFGPSTPGLLNLVAGNTYPATPSGGSSAKVVNINNGVGTLVGDLDPTGDVCSAGVTIQMGGRNIGDLLDAKGLSWGSFMGGFDLTVKNPDGSTGCARQSPAAGGGSVADYIPHHAFFQYWPSTANPNHIRPSVPPSQYGSSADAANHEYDLHDFFDALRAGNLPAVSFLKAPANMDGHAGYSDPLLEQQFIVTVINALERSPLWSSTAVFINWDDSDGWYDHQMSPIVNPSAVANPSDTKNSDQLNGAGKCGNGTPLKDDQGNVIQGRCGYGPRIPLLVISPWAKANFVSHSLADQSSILRFIEDNWSTGRIGNGSFDALAGPLDNMFDFSADNGAPSRRLFLDPDTGQPVPPM